MNATTTVQITGTDATATVVPMSTQWRVTRGAEYLGLVTPKGTDWWTVEGHPGVDFPSLQAAGEYLVSLFPAADEHGNRQAREGVDRCTCGAKYWEHDRCVDCGAHVSQVTAQGGDAIALEAALEAARQAGAAHKAAIDARDEAEADLAAVYRLQARAEAALAAAEAARVEARQAAADAESAVVSLEAQ